MAFAKVLADTNVLIDYLQQREPFYSDARLLMLAANVGDVEVWMSASQVTDLVYILSDGGASGEIGSTLERLRVLWSFVRVAPIDAWCVDRMFATSWQDPEDALVNEVALVIKADCIVTRDAYLQQHAAVPAFDCSGFFDWLEETQGLTYEEVPF